MKYLANIKPEDTIAAIEEFLIKGDRYDFVLDLENSHGSYMVDKLDPSRQILDFYTCFASSPLGFNHPGLLDENTLAKLTAAAVNNVTNSDLYTDLKAEFVQTFFKKAAPPEMKYMFFIAGGALAVENAMKTAFDYKMQKNRMAGDTRSRELKIMHFKGAFHGRTGYTMSVTNTDAVKTDMFPKFDWPRIENAYVKFPDAGALHEDTLRREKLALEQAKNFALTYGNSIAAFLFEPIQGEGGDNHFRPEFLTELQNLCHENDMMFIVDEVQTGMGITGKMWAHQHHGLKPDILCFGKKAQVCGILATNKVEEVEHHVFNTGSRINSTWGGNLVDMVRCARYLEIYEQERLVENAAEMGKALLSGLQKTAEAFPHLVSNPRGKGLYCAFDVTDAGMRQKIISGCYKKNMLVLACGSRSIRFRPAMTVSTAEISEAMRILNEVLRGL